MSGSLVCICSFTAMLPRAPSESPASRASALSGATPIASSTRSASVSVLSLNCTRTPGFRVGKAGDGAAEQELDAVLSEVRVEEARHVPRRTG